MGSDQLRALYAWIPMLPADDDKTAALAAKRFGDARALHYWDSERYLGKLIARELSIGAQESGAAGAEGIAWDVYLAYSRRTTEIRRPEFWMHQLAVKHAPRLDAAEFARRVKALLQT